MARRALAKKSHYRCARCHCLVPTMYTRCGECGYDSAAVDDFIRRAKLMFPGSLEQGRKET